MTPKGGLQGFVQNKNPQQDVRNTGSPSANHDFNDLKSPVPKSSSKTQKKQKTKQSSAGQNQPGRQSQFRDDASSRSNNSSTDAISTTASTSRPGHGGNQQMEFHQSTRDRNAVDGDHLSAAFGGTSYTESLNDSLEGGLLQEPVTNYGARIDSKFQDFLHESRADQPGLTIAQTPIKGDSYPPTSAGAPSMTDQREQDLIGIAGNHQYGPNQAIERGAFPDRVQKPQMQTSSARRQQMPDLNVHVQLPVSSRQPHKPTPFDSEPSGPGYDAGSGFSYAPVKKDVAIHSSRIQRPNVGQQLYTANNKVTVAHPHKHVAQQDIHPIGAQISPFERQGHQTVERQRHEGYDQVNEPNRSAQQVQQVQHTEQAPLSEAYTEEAGSEQTEEQEFHPNILDYDQSELFKGDLQSLQSEPFDQGASAQPFVISDMPDSATLADKVAHIARAEQKTQSEFFASLNIDEWEDAGDWFLDRFGDTIKKLKDVRRAKRKAALAFEEDIEKREIDVDKKHALTTVALDEMKTSGTAILQGTPKKGK
ncbi:hypothetical protein Q7P37_005482 [Cladosporium fusiforme]